MKQIWGTGEIYTGFWWENWAKETTYKTQAWMGG